MTEWLKRIEEWSKLNEEDADRDKYSTGLFILVLSGLCMRLPLILNVIIQACFFICTVHLIYWYFKRGHYILALVKIGLIIALFLVENMFYFNIEVV